jgi:hypothetical protein
MVLGLSVAAAVAVHVVISLAGIAAGMAALVGMLRGQWWGGMTVLFLVTTVLTSLSGFPLPAPHLLPSHVVGFISVGVLAVALLALYAFHLAGPWRWIYVVGAVAALYLNVFVAVAQAFAKVGPLRRLAPTQSEPPFLMAQLLVLAVFAALGVRAVRRFHPAPG